MNKKLESFSANGFYIEKQLFPKAEVEQLKKDALTIFENQLRRLKAQPLSDSELERMACLFNRDFAAFVNSGKHVQHLISLHRLSLSSNILNVLSELGISRPNICTRPVLYFNHQALAKEDVYHTVFAHQDWRSMQGSINAIVCWVPLVDMTSAIGALEVVPKSHKRGLISESVRHGFGEVTSYKDEDFESVELEVGDALFFNAFLVHRSGKHTNNEIRWSCHFRYNDLEEKTFIERGYPHPYIYKPNDNLLNPEFDTTKELNCYLSSLHE